MSRPGIPLRLAENRATANEQVRTAPEGGRGPQAPQSGAQARPVARLVSTEDVYWVSTDHTPGPQTMVYDDIGPAVVPRPAGFVMPELEPLLWDGDQG